jgi:hypothetical protein
VRGSREINEESTMLRLLNENNQPLPTGFLIYLDHAGDWWLAGAEGGPFPLGRWADATEAARDAWRELHIRKLA